MYNTNEKSIWVYKSFLWLTTGVVILAILSTLSLTLNVEAFQLAQEELTNKAINQAQFFGLQGGPSAQKAVQMRYVEWLELSDAELGVDAEQFGLIPDMPVLVLAMRGDVARQMPLRPNPEKIPGDRFDNITIVLKVETGELLSLSVSPSADLMPVRVDE